MIELEEFAPGRWRVLKTRYLAPVSDLPKPMVISDTMDPVEQVDGKFYTSKRQYRAVGKAHGLIEVGDQKLPPKLLASADPSVKAVRKRAIHTAIQKYKAGVRSS